MKQIKKLWPEQKLILVCRKGLGDFFLKTQLVDEVLEIKKGDRGSYARAMATLKSQSLENIISPHESLRTAFFVRPLKARRKVSFRKVWNFLFYNQRVLKNKRLPDAIRQMSLLSPLDPALAQKIAAYSLYGKPIEVTVQGTLSEVPEWASMSLKKFYQAKGSEVAVTLNKHHLNSELIRKSVALFPGSVWATKRWTEDGYIKTGQKLASQGIPVLVMGGPGEEELCTRIAAQIPGAKDLCARTSIFESALILSQVAAVVGNDSASMHLAATSDTASVVVFGPTVLEFGFRPWQDQVFVVEKKDLACRPCGKHGHHECPIGTHVCMKGIHQDEVLEKLKGVLHEI